jgi:hypothetical protein
MKMPRVIHALWGRLRPIKLVVDYQQDKGWYVGMVEGYTKKIGPYHAKPELAIQLKAVLSQIEEK